MKKNTSNRGFTIFFATLVSALALAVGLAIYDLTIRELDLSMVATQSQAAIYAADTGAECALYWDSKYTNAAAGDLDGSVFATSSDYTHGGIATVGQAYCVGQDIVAANSIVANIPANSNAGWVITAGDTQHATTTFAISMGASANSPCALITVAKFGTPAHTTVVSHGYNTCAAAGVARLERILQLSY